MKAQWACSAHARGQICGTLKAWAQSSHTVPSAHIPLAKERQFHWGGNGYSYRDVRGRDMNVCSPI